jgi:hypothetical protein
VRTALRNGVSSQLPSCTVKDSYRPADGLIEVRLLQAIFVDMRKLGVVKDRVDAQQCVDMSSVREAAGQRN